MLRCRTDEDVVSAAPAAFALPQDAMATTSAMSRAAVSCEQPVSFAHFDELSLPSKSSSRRLSTFTCRGFSEIAAQAFQQAASRNTAASVSCAPPIARPRHARNHSTPPVMSPSPFCVRSRTSW